MRQTTKPWGGVRLSQQVEQNVLERFEEHGEGTHLERDEATMVARRVPMRVAATSTRTAGPTRTATSSWSLKGVSDAGCSVSERLCLASRRNALLE